MPSFDESVLDIAQLNEFAVRAAMTTRAAPQVKIEQMVTKSVPGTEVRRSGLFGRRTETVRVLRSVKSSEIVIGSHWILHRTDHHIESHQGKKYQEYHENNFWALQHDGQLMTIRSWDQFTSFTDGTSRHESECTAKPMVESDILRLDYADKQYEYGTHGHGEKIWGCREPGRRIRHAKGVGLSLAIKELLPK